MSNETTSLLISETYIDRTRNLNCGEVPPYEPWTQDAGRLFRSLRREYGRCTGSIRIDTPDGRSPRIGWVFLKRRQYEDTGGVYLAETWVTLHRAVDTVVRTAHYFELDGVRRAES